MCVCVLLGNIDAKIRDSFSASGFSSNEADLKPMLILRLTISQTLSCGRARPPSGLFLYVKLFPSPPQNLHKPGSDLGGR